MSRKSNGVKLDTILKSEMSDDLFRHHFVERKLIHEVALAVKGMREASGLTQAQLAELIDSTQPVIARLENGRDQRTPRWDLLNRVALALGKRLKLVFHDPASPPEPLVEVKGRLRRRKASKAAA